MGARLSCVAPHKPDFRASHVTVTVDGPHEVRDIHVVSSKGIYFSIFFCNFLTTGERVVPAEEKKLRVMAGWLRFLSFFGQSLLD